MDISIPSSCVPPPSSPKSMLILDPQVFRLLQTTMIRGWGDLRRLNRMKWLFVDKNARLRQLCQPLLSLIVDVLRPSRRLSIHLLFHLFAVVSENEGGILKSIGTPAIIGISVGMVVVVVTLCAVLIFYCKRRRMRQRRSRPRPQRKSMVYVYIGVFDFLSFFLRLSSTK